MVPKKSGLQLIIDERVEQVSKHGYGPENDDDHVQGELLDLASFCLGKHVNFPKMFPVAKSKISAKPLIKRLTIAGALIAAEIDRLLRAEKPSVQMICHGADGGPCDDCFHSDEPHPRRPSCEKNGNCPGCQESPTPMTCQGKDSAKCIGPRCAHYPDGHDQDEYCMTPGICGYSCFRVCRIEEDKPITKQVVCPLGEHCVVGACSHKEKHDVKDWCSAGAGLCPNCVPAEEEVGQADEPEWMSLEVGQPIVVWDRDGETAIGAFFSSYDDDIHLNYPVNVWEDWKREDVNSYVHYRLPTEKEMDTIGLDKNRWKYTKD